MPTSEGPRSIRLVLDTSAILAYAHGSVQVGAPLAEIDDEEAAVGLPTPCVVEARWTVGDPGRLDLLVRHRATKIVGLSEDWSALRAAVDIVGRHDVAAALRVAADLGCAVLTAEPGLYAGLAGGGPVIAFAY